MPRSPKRPRPETPESDENNEASSSAMSASASGSGRPARRSTRLTRNTGDSDDEEQPVFSQEQAEEAFPRTEELMADADADEQEAEDGAQTQAATGFSALRASLRAMLGLPPEDGPAAAPADEDDDEENDEDWVDEDDGESQSGTEEEEEDDGIYQGLGQSGEDDEDEDDDDDGIPRGYLEDEDEDEDDAPYGFSNLSGLRRLLQRQRARADDQILKYPRYRTMEQSNKIGLKQLEGIWKIQNSIVSTPRRSDNSHFKNRTGTVSISSLGTGSVDISHIIPQPHPHSTASKTRLENFRYDSRLGAAWFEWRYQEEATDPRAVQKTVYDEEWKAHDEKVRQAIGSGVGLAWLCTRQGSDPSLVLLMENGERAEGELPVKEEKSKGGKQYGVAVGLGVGKLAKSPLIRLAMRVLIVAEESDDVD